jgi:hypothetical protein
LKFKRFIHGLKFKTKLSICFEIKTRTRLYRQAGQYKLLIEKSFSWQQFLPPQQQFLE